MTHFTIHRVTAVIYEKIITRVTSHLMQKYQHNA